MQLQLTDLKLELDEYYGRVFPTEAEDSAANAAVKQKIGELVIAAHSAGLNDVKQEALDLLASSTGCMEDDEILLEITDVLIQQGILSEETAQDMFDKAPSSRWR